MSAPTTNIEKQRKWHRPALLGIGAVVLVVGALFVAFLGAVTSAPDTAPSTLPENIAADQ